VKTASSRLSSSRTGVTRPALRWHGGKWKLAPWIISHFPVHRVYVEPFGGAASVLLRKPRAYGEVYNDLDGDVVNLFRVLQDKKLSAELVRRLRLTPFARAEFERSYLRSRSPIERARRLMIICYMGFGSNGHNRKTRTGFRANSNRSGTTPAHDWKNYPDALPVLIDRLQGVVIEQRDALDVMRQHDSGETLHYVDPPYLWHTRTASSKRRRYVHEMNDADHTKLLDCVLELRGSVVLSGYKHAQYDEALAGWKVVDTASHADGALARVERLWINPTAAGQMRLQQPELF
jgi:DNA adenine methylase